MPTSAQLEKMTQQLLKSPLLQPDAAATRVSQAAEQTGASRFLQGRGPANNARLSKKGREVVVAARQVLESLLRIGLEKNSDDKIQRFIFACSKASVDVDASISQSFPQVRKHELTTSTNRETGRAFAVEPGAQRSQRSAPVPLQLAHFVSSPQGHFGRLDQPRPRLVRRCCRECRQRRDRNRQDVQEGSQIGST